MQNETVSVGMAKVSSGFSAFASRAKAFGSTITTKVGEVAAEASRRTNQSGPVATNVAGASEDAAADTPMERESVPESKPAAAE